MDPFKGLIIRNLVQFLVLLDLPRFLRFLYCRRSPGVFALPAIDDKIDILQNIVKILLFKCKTEYNFSPTLVETGSIIFSNLPVLEGDLTRSESGAQHKACTYFSAFFLI